MITNRRQPPSRFLTRCASWLVVAVVSGATAADRAEKAIAQQNRAPAKTAVPSAGSKAASPPRPPAQPAKPPDNEAREAVLRSPSWQDTMQRFSDWLSIQVLYDPEEIRHLKARLNAGLDRMSADQLEVFEADLRSKLDVLTSPRALDAQSYLAEKFLVASDAYARRIRQQIPDVLSMTPAQIEQALAIFASRRQSRQQSQAAFEQGRQASLASNAAAVQARMQQQRDRAAARSGVGAGVSAGQNNLTPARDYFPERNNNMSIIVGGGFY